MSSAASPAPSGTPPDPAVGPAGDPGRAYVVVNLEPLPRRRRWRGAARTVARLQQLSPAALCDAGPERVRAVLPVELGADERRSLARLDVALDRIARGGALVAGRSGVRRDPGADRAAQAEAVAATRIVRALLPGGGARAWEALGAYRYLVEVDVEIEPDPRHAAAIGRLRAYDERRGSELVGTLERYLAERSVVPTARVLAIHPNTLRQRLERIERVTGVVVAEEDLLSLELAIKRHRLRRPDDAAGSLGSR